MFKRVLGNPRLKSLARNVVVTNATRSLLVWITSTRQRIHTAEKLYECTRCEKSFTQKSALSHKLKAHDKRVSQRNFTCAKCSETFHNLAPYNAHIRTAHSTIQPATARKRTAEKTTDAPAAKKPMLTYQVSASTATQHQALLKHGLQNQVLAGKWIPFLSLQTLFQALMRILLRCTDSTNHRFAPYLAATTDLDWYTFRLSTISPTTLREKLNTR